MRKKTRLELMGTICIILGVMLFFVSLGAEWHFASADEKAIEGEAVGSTWASITPYVQDWPQAIIALIALLSGAKLWKRSKNIFYKLPPR